MKLDEAWLMNWTVTEPNTGCWLWVRGVDKDGYGRVRVKDKTIGVHRLSWEIYNGLIPGDKFVCHNCDMPPCWNPKHLFLGDALKNNWDCFNKGRRSTWFVNIPANRNCGVRNCNAKATPEIVRLIRNSSLDSIALSKELGISHGNIRKIRRGELWKNV